MEGVVREILNKRKTENIYIKATPNSKLSSIVLIPKTRRATNPTITKNAYF
jgi:hypothetical protein